MTKLKGLALTLFIAAGMISFAGCSNNASEEEMQQLETRRQEVNSLNTEITQLRSEKSRLEREIGEKNAKLQQCARDKEETRNNLDKLPK